VKQAATSSKQQARHHHDTVAAAAECCALLVNSYNAAVSCMRLLLVGCCVRASQHHVYTCCLCHRARACCTTSCNPRVNAATVLHCPLRIAVSCGFDISAWQEQVPTAFYTFHENRVFLALVGHCSHLCMCRGQLEFLSRARHYER
jgi:hypothetical protein